MFEPSLSDPTNTVRLSIVDLRISVGLEVSSEDIKELVDEHNKELIITQKL